LSELSNLEKRGALPNAYHRPAARAPTTSPGPAPKRPAIYVTCETEACSANSSCCCEPLASSELLTQQRRNLAGFCAESCPKFT